MAGRPHAGGGDPAALDFELGTASYFRGLIDEVQLFETCLSPSAAALLADVDWKETNEAKAPLVLSLPLTVWLNITGTTATVALDSQLRVMAQGAFVTGWEVLTAEGSAQLSTSGARILPHHESSTNLRSTHLSPLSGVRSQVKAGPQSPSLIAAITRLLLG